MNITTRFILVTPMREKGGSGVQTYTNSFHNYLTKNGFSSRIITPYSYWAIVVYPIFFVQKLLDKVVGEWSISWSRFWRYYFLKQTLKKILNRQAYNGTSTVIYAQCPLSAKAALMARHNMNQKVILIVHYNVSQADEWANKGKIKLKGRLYNRIKILEESLIPQLDRIVYVSQFMKQMIEDAIPQAKSIKSASLPCFTNKPSVFHSKQTKRDLINIGTLESRKNQAYLLQVLASAKRKGFSYTLTLVGDGEDKQKLEKLAKQLDIRDKVLFLGFQKNAAKILSDHRIYVHSALIENLPISLLEALSHNLPIIAGAVGGIPEVFNDGIEGYFWPLDNSEKGADILIQSMENKTKYQELVLATERRFSSQFQTETVAREVVNFLEA
jgi:glycosyltransferase involved in cell wall biosynthesis